VKTQLRAEIENDQLAYYKELYEKHGADAPTSRTGTH
jgi:hypothetical protein